MLPALLLLLVAGMAACQREDRSRTSDPQMETKRPSQALLDARYGRNAYQIGEGQRLYKWMNCGTCHGAAGGGGMGPPLMDDQWRYGSAMADIVATIDQGRPNGMPSFHSRLTGQQRAQLAAYVRALGGLAPTDAVPSRSDGFAAGEPLTQHEPPPPATDSAR
jgi:cytochrome c oxidase cbb3-type subunit 3